MKRSFASVGIGSPRSGARRAAPPRRRGRRGRSWAREYPVFAGPRRRRRAATCWPSRTTQPLEPSVDRGDDRVLHLHRLDDDDGLVALTDAPSATDGDHPPGIGAVRIAAPSRWRPRAPTASSTVGGLARANSRLCPSTSTWTLSTVADRVGAPRGERTVDRPLSLLVAVATRTGGAFRRQPPPHGSGPAASRERAAARQCAVEGRAARGERACRRSCRSASRHRASPGWSSSQRRKRRFVRTPSTVVAPRAARSRSSASSRVAPWRRSWRASGRSGRR